VPGRLLVVRRAVVRVSSHQQIGPLRQLLEDTAAVEGLAIKDLTVLAKQRDPFRLDTPANHRDGAWLANTAKDLGLGNRLIHLRGLHYMVLGRPKPNGRPYANTDDDWLWLSEEAGKAARWLGYLSFDQIIDRRNAAPTVREFTDHGRPWPYISVGIDIDIPDADEITPEIGALGFDGTQPYRLVMVGEKASLAEVLAPGRRTLRGRPVPPNRGDLRHPHPPDGQGRRRRRPPHGGAVLRRRRPGRLADGHLGRP
jgi:hypothetical protein